MREILFRGKRVDNGEWVEGYYVADTEWSKYYIYQPQHTGVYIELRAIKVHPETVGQFTGLLDKNGKRIFEGDVLDYGISKKQVVFLNGSFGVVNKSEAGSSFGSYQIDNGVVIGNIHDNPELL